MTGAQGVTHLSPVAAPLLTPSPRPATALDLRVLGEYQQARTLAEDTLTRRRRVLGDDHPDTLTSANNLAADLHELGEHQQAQRWRAWAAGDRRTDTDTTRRPAW